MSKRPLTPKPRGHLLALAPYARADALPAAGRPVLLAQNENASPPSPLALAAAHAAFDALGRYPDADAAPLRQAIGAAEDLKAEQIICGAGSAELISLICQAFLRAGDEVVVSQYGYLYFRTAARACEAEVVLAPERALSADVDAMLAQVGPRTRLMFLANPNNPTGSLLPRAEVQRLRTSLRDDVLLVIDAAYAEYVEEADFDPGVELVDTTANTVMLRTFSKVHGLAGLRVGWGYFPPNIAAAVNRIAPLNNINAIGLAAATAAIGDREHVLSTREQNSAAREDFRDRLRRLGFSPHPSHGNFALVPFATATAASSSYAFLKARNILVRPMAAYGLDNFLRVTIGAAHELDAACTALADWRLATKSC